MIGALVRNYERPQDKEGAIRTRQGYYAGFKPSTPTAQAPVPAGTSAQAVTDAEVFAARQRIINGSRNPNDKALVDRYLKEQNTPKAPAPVTFDHAIQHVLKTMARARKLTHQNDNKPIRVLPVGRDGSPASHAAMTNMIHMASMGRHVAAASSRSVSNSSDTRIGSINVHTAATDARGIAADIEPHLHRGQAAGRADYGLA